MGFYNNLYKNAKINKNQKSEKNKKNMLQFVFMCDIFNITKHETTQNKLQRGLKTIK